MNEKTENENPWLRDRDLIDLMQDRIAAQGKIDRGRIEDLEDQVTNHEDHIKLLEAHSSRDAMRIAELEARIKLSETKAIDLEVKLDRFTDDIRTLVNDVYVSSLARTEGLSAELAEANQRIAKLEAGTQSATRPVSAEGLRQLVAIVLDEHKRRIAKLEARMARLHEVFGALNTNVDHDMARTDAQKQPQEGV